MNNHYNGVIPEGSTITVLVNNDFEAGICTANNDMRVEPNSFMLLGGGSLGSPICVETVEKISDNEYIFHSWWQDCLVMRNDILFESYSHAI